MRLLAVPVLAFAMLVCATAGPGTHYQVLGLRQLAVPGTNTTSVDVDKLCLQQCESDATQLHHYKQDDCSKGSQLDQQKCACKSPYLPDLKKCITKCVTPADAAQKAVDELETACAKVLATGAAPALSAPLHAMVLALGGVVVTSMF
ncbi:hypothetical protein AURDEDRAFT_129750 [Auricularia subglabra TFB-10046 SS5]|uniref:Extracellular membrane protein CFEM domain-containing protein n=1 Tax=Auricularia subglabra (strain TFB-10046 / SS5) TaxID=717982 RepID=J0WVF9_AURST|nr:hypothetical protein AURDEDRAFT_129750 [Auricularia subglabra TFB-10046 SS5]